MSLARSPQRLLKPLLAESLPRFDQILDTYERQGCLSGTSLSRYDWILQESIEGDLKGEGWDRTYVGESH